MGVQTALDAVRDAPGIIDAMRLADDLAFEAGRNPGVRTLRVLASALNGDDEVAAIAAVHALAQIFDEQAARMLSAPALRRPRDDPRARGLGAGLRAAALRRHRAAHRPGGRRRIHRHARPAHPRAVVVGGGRHPRREPRERAARRARAGRARAAGRDARPRAPGDRDAPARSASPPISGEHDDVRIAAVAALGQRPGVEGVERPARGSRRAATGCSATSRGWRSSTSRRSRSRRTARDRGPDDRAALPARRHRPLPRRRRVPATTAASPRCWCGSGTRSSPTRRPACRA